MARPNAHGALSTRHVHDPLDDSTTRRLVMHTACAIRRLADASVPAASLPQDPFCYPQCNAQRPWGCPDSRAQGSPCPQARQTLSYDLRSVSVRRACTADKKLSARLDVTGMITPKRCLGRPWPKQWPDVVFEREPFGPPALHVSSRADSHDR